MNIPGHHRRQEGGIRESIIPCLILILAGYAAFSFLFTRDPFVYDDHGFHYASLSRVLTDSQPVFMSIFGWNPTWFAGIPEFQFYPPGFVILGVLINTITLGSLSTGTIYQSIIIFCLLLPGIAGYFLLKDAGFSKWAALVSGMMLLLYPAGASGTLFGVIFGLLNSRIALGLVLLIIICYINLLSHPKKFYLRILLCLLISFLVLMHPYHIFLAVIAIFSQLFTWSKTGLIEAKNGVRKTVISIVIGIGITAFWWIPLILYSDYMGKMQVWSAGAGLKDLIYSLSGDFQQKYFMGMYCLTGISLLHMKYTTRQKSLLAGLLLTPVLMLAFLFFVRLVLMGLLKFHSIDPWRLQDDFYFSIMVTSGLGILFPLQAGMQKLKESIKSIHHISFASSSILISLVLLTGGFQIINPSFQLKGYGKFGFLQHNTISLQLDELWGYLKKEKEGRVLFTSARINIPGYPDIINTHVLALTPQYTGRSILGAVNEPFYATASYLYFGKLPPVIIRQEADALQNVSLFGIPWKQMDDTRFWELCAAFNVTSIVINDKETEAKEFLDRSGLFRQMISIGPNTVYSVQNYEPSWFYSESRGKIHLIKWNRNQIDIEIEHPDPDTSLLIKMGYYPRWHAYVDGKSIPLYQDKTGLMKVFLPAGNSYLLSIKYETTFAEWAGIFISMFSACILILFAAMDRKGYYSSLI